MSQNLCINRNRTQPHGGTSTKGGKGISRAVNILERIDKGWWQNRFLRG